MWFHYLWTVVWDILHLYLLDASVLTKPYFVAPTRSTLYNIDQNNRQTCYTSTKYTFTFFLMSQSLAWPRRRRSVYGAKSNTVVVFTATATDDMVYRLCDKSIFLFISVTEIRWYETNFRSGSTEVIIRWSETFYSDILTRLSPPLLPIPMLAINSFLWEKLFIEFASLLLYYP